MRTVILSFFLLLGSISFAQHKGDHPSVDIKSNAVCGMCKKTIETELLYEKGVKSVSLDLASSVIHVDYDTKKTEPAKIRQAVAKLGYAADDVAPDMKARENLPACCRTEGCGMPAEKH